MRPAPYLLPLLVRDRRSLRRAVPDRRPVAGAGAALVVTSLASFMALLDATIVNVSFPAIRASFPTATLGDLSWILNAYAIVFAALLVPSGRLADRYGRRRVFTGGLAVFGLASLLCAVAPSVGLLVVARGAQAAGAAMMLPTSLAILLAATPAEARARALGVWSAVGAIAAAVGPPLGGLIVAAGDWRLVFLANVPVAAAAWFAARRTLAESRDPSATGVPDLLGAALVAAAIAVLSLALVEGNAWGWRSQREIAAVALAVVLAPLIARRSSRHAVPVLDPALLRDRRFVIAGLGALLFSLGFFAVLLGNVLFLSGVWHYSVLRSGLAILPSPLAAASAAMIGSRLVGRLGERALISVGGTVFAAGATWLALRAGQHPAFLRTWIPGSVSIGVGIGLTLPTLGIAAARAVAPAQFAVSSAVTAMARQIGGVLGVAAVVALAAGRTDSIAVFDRNWALAAGAGLATAVAARGLGGRLRTPEEA